MKWLGWLSMAFIAMRFFGANWAGRIFLVAMYSNYLLFFGPSALAQIRQRIRRYEFQRKMRR